MMATWRYAMLSRKTLAAGIRTGAYGALAAGFAVSHAEGIAIVNAILVGGMSADYVSWLMGSLFLLPTGLAHGSYELLINVAFGWFALQYLDVSLPADGQSVGWAFLAFLLVMTVKVAYYGVAFVNRSEDEE
jgi:hypothetical protein